MHKLILFLICVVLCLSGCRANSESAHSSNDSAKNTSSDIIYEGNTSKAEVVEPSLPDLMLGITECDKTVTVYGELTNPQYQEHINELESVLDRYDQNISLCVYALDNSRALCYNTAAEIFGACTVKAPYTFYCCKQLEQGVGSLDDVITYEQKHYEWGTGDMQYSPFGTQFSLRTAMHKSMSISDNVGYLMTVDYFGSDGYNEWVESLGCESLKIKPTVWSLKTKSIDLVKVWREIYNYFESNSQYAAFLKESCTNTADNYATAALENVSYSHKQGHNSTGEWLSYSDAGIVYKENSPYVIAVLTDAAGGSAKERQLMAQIINIIHNQLF